MLAEALERLQFLASCSEASNRFADDIATIQSLQEAFEAGEFLDCQSLIETFDKSAKLVTALENFIKKRCKESSLFNYWSTLKLP